MLCGSLPPTSRSVQWLSGFLIGVFLTPWLLMALGLTGVGARAIFDPTRFGELLICFPAGVALLVLVGAITFTHFWWMPGRTLAAFRFDGQVLTYETLGSVVGESPITHLRIIRDQHGSRGRGLRGWWLGFAHYPWIYVSRNTENASVLIETLKAHLEGVG